MQAPVARELGGSDPGKQIEFWHTLADRPVTSNDDALHGLLLFLDGQDDSADYAARVEAMKQRKMLPAGFRAAGDEAVDRGTVAVALVRALGIRGGWAMHVLGPNPRYAVKELQFLEVYPPSSPNQTFSGSEFLGIIGKAEDYQRGNAAVVPAPPPEIASGIPGAGLRSSETQPADTRPAETHPAAGDNG